jgi:hypothetical protein
MGQLITKDWQQKKILFIGHHLGMQVGHGLADLLHEEAALLLSQGEVRRYDLLEKLATVQDLRDEANLSKQSDIVVNFY